MSLRVLLVDDATVNLDIIGSFLKAAGHSVTLAQSGQEAVELAQKQMFDLILMDIRMPKVDGLAAARQIRLGAGNASVPILALTAYGDDEADFEAAGISGYLPKPLDYTTLIRGIDAAMALRD